MISHSKEALVRALNRVSDASFEIKPGANMEIGWSRDDTPDDASGIASNLIEDWEEGFKYVQRKVLFTRCECESCSNVSEVRDMIWTADLSMIDDESFDCWIEHMAISAMFDAHRVRVDKCGKLDDNDPVVIYEMYKINESVRDKILMSRSDDNEIMWDERDLSDAVMVWTLRCYVDRIYESRMEWSKIEAVH